MLTHMLTRGLRLSALGVAMALAVPANAVTITFSKTDPNFGISPTRPIIENFDNVSLGNYGVIGEQATGPALVNPSVGLANTGAFAYNADSLAIGRARRPGVTGGSPGNAFAGLSTGNFAGLGNGGRYTVLFADYGTPVLRTFSYSHGSISSQNRVTLISANGPNVVLQGFNIVNNDTNVVGDNYRVRFDAGNAPGAGWTGVVFESGSIAFEFDNLAGAAPEPATWAMLLLGFGVSGFALRRNRAISLA